MVTVIFLLLSFLFPGPIASQAATAIDAQLAEARSFVNAGKSVEAIANLRALPDLSSPRVTHLLGVAYYHANEYISRPSSNWPPGYGTARRVARTAGSYSGSRNVALSRRTCHYLLAQVLKKMGQIEDAKREFAIAKKLYGELDR